MDTNKQLLEKKKRNKNIKNKRLYPYYHPGENGPPMALKQTLALYAILSPILIIASPIIIPSFIKWYVKDKIIQYKFNHLQKDQMEEQIVLNEDRKKLALKRAFQNIQEQSYPIVISRHKNIKPQMMLFSPRRNITRWQEIEKQFKQRKSIKKSQTVFFYAGAQMLNSLFTVRDIYNKWKSQDKILYVRYQKLQVFG